MREAVRSLEQAGLVQLKKGAHGGIFITGNNGASVAIVSGLLDLYRLGGIAPRHLTQARIWVESIVIREACQRATASDIAALNANIDAAVAAAESGEFETKVALNHEFHRILARMTDNPIMIAFINGLIEVLVEFVIRIGPHDTSYIFPARRRFMAHFERGDAEAAVQEMTSVLEQFQEAAFPEGNGRLRLPRAVAAMPVPSARQAGTGAAPFPRHRRQPAGGWPNSRLNARLKAASDS
ncbi:FadR/GntR family transcriptional regulator [Cupriavidus basilensis]